MLIFQFPFPVMGPHRISCFPVCKPGKSADGLALCGRCLTVSSSFSVVEFRNSLDNTIEKTFKLLLWPHFSTIPFFRFFFVWELFTTVSYKKMRITIYPCVMFTRLHIYCNGELSLLHIIRHCFQRCSFPSGH